MDEKTTRAFFHFAESWYYERCRKARREGAPVDDVTFGHYAAEGHGGCEAELVMEWVPLGDFRKPTACLRVWDSDFEMLEDFADVWRELASEAAIPLTPRRFCEVLKQCGFKDLTQRKGPRE